MTFDNMWDVRFAEQEYAYGTQPNTFLQQQISKLKQGKLLTLAEGEGRNAVFLAKQGFKVVAVDASVEGIKKAKRLAAINSVEIEFIHADLTTFDLGENCWDSVVSIFSPLAETERYHLHQKVVKSLKQNGTFLMEAYTPEQIKFATGGGNDVSTMLTEEQAKRELKGLDFKLLQEIERSVIEGKFHTGNASVLQAIAKKAL